MVKSFLTKTDQVPVERNPSPPAGREKLTAGLGFTPKM